MASRAAGRSPSFSSSSSTSTFALSSTFAAAGRWWVTDRKASPVSDDSSLVLHVYHLSRNVNEANLKEIFENYGEIVNVELSMDRVVNLPLGYGYVEFKRRADAEKALLYMDGAQIDGNVVKVRFTPTTRQRAAASPKALLHPPKRDVLKMIELVIILERPLNSDLENHLLKESHFHLHEGDLLQFKELIHLGGGLILLQFTVGKIPHQSGAMKHFLAGDQGIQLEDVLPLHRLEGLHHQGGFHQEEVVAVQSADALHCLLEG